MSIWGQWPFGEMPMFGFDLIMIDPPWLFETWTDEGKDKSPEAHYDCLPTDVICQLPVGQLGAKDAVFWLWATHPMHRDGFRCFDSWGVRYVTGGTWVKRTAHGKLGFGTGYRLRCASEPFLIGTNGSPETARNVRTVIEGRVREHSRKPDEAYAAAEQLMEKRPGHRFADIFSREQRPGWTTWGNEDTKFTDGRSARRKSKPVLDDPQVPLI